MIRLFPYIFSRKASGAFGRFQEQNFSEIGRWMRQLEILTERHYELQNRLNPRLFSFISGQSDTRIQNEVLKVKRNVYNGREIRIDPTIPFPPDLEELLKCYRQVQEEIAAWYRDYYRLYDQSAEQARRALQFLSRDEDFLKSLVFSSRALLNQISFYQAAPPGSFTKNDANAELSVLRYLTRMYFKTSPFSRMTSVGVTPVFEKDPQEASENQGRMWSSVRINNYLLFFLKTLCSHNPEVRVHLPLCLNPTLERVGDHYTFLLNYSNVEAFQRLPVSDLLDIIVPLIRERNEPFTISTLSKELATVHVEAPAADVVAYLVRLVEYGFLEFDIRGSGTDAEWNSAFTDRMSRLGFLPAILGMLAGLERLLLLANQMSMADASTRRVLLSRSSQELESMANLHLRTMGVSFEMLRGDKYYLDRFISGYNQADQWTIKPYLQAEFNLFYEDAVHLERESVDADELAALLAPMDRLISCLSRYDTYVLERRKMLDHYREVYSGHDNVSLLDFYQSYYSHVKTREKEDRLVQQTATTPDISPAQSKWEKRCYDLLEKAMDHYTPVFNIDQGLLEALCDTEAEGKAYARGAFIQLFAEEGETKGVVNSTCIGMGRSIGRFLHLFDPEVTDRFREWNLQLCDDRYMMAEIADASHFNANLHPALLPYKIVLAGNPTDGGNFIPISVVDLVVTAEESGGSVSLEHKREKKRVLPFDLCLQATGTRSELYQLISAMGRAQSYSPEPFIRIVNHAFENRFRREMRLAEGIYLYPRIVLHGKTVIRRKRWYVDQAVIPLKNKSETEPDYFLKVWEWREKLGVPEEVFMLINPNLWPPGSPQAPKVGKDDYKPQYVHFANPLLVRLFGKEVKKVPDVLCLEEMYPDTSLLSQRDTGHVNETLVEWYGNLNKDLL